MTWATEIDARVAEALVPLGDPERAQAMSAYMRDLFPFLGVTSRPRREAVKHVIRAAPPDEASLLEAATLLWNRPEREYQYCACDLLARHVSRLSPVGLPQLTRLIVAKPWWDSVDALATHVVGALVREHPELRREMDVFLASDELWLVRTAILHQERWMDATDADWLFTACASRAGEPDFFIRKAIGWALRSYAKTDPSAVRAFVEGNGRELSGLSRREAMRGVIRAEEAAWAG